MGMTTKASTVNGIPLAEYAAHRDWVWPFLLEIERHDKDGQSAREYEEQIQARDLQVWALGEREGVCLTRVTREAVRLEWVAGKNRNRWQKDLDRALRDWARALGVKRLIVLARPGWASLAKELGYREFQRGYEVRL